jgi:NDP-sugar pyrophosphorylase family protein
MPEGAFSLESDFFPKLVGQEFYGFPTDAELVDIGTPERYERAQHIFFS